MCHWLFAFLLGVWRCVCVVLVLCVCRLFVGLGWWGWWNGGESGRGSGWTRGWWGRGVGGAGRGGGCVGLGSVTSSDCPLSLSPCRWGSVSVTSSNCPLSLSPCRWAATRTSQWRVWLFFTCSSLGSVRHLVSSRQSLFIIIYSIKILRIFLRYFRTWV